jgi:hypothetical protein
MTQELVSWARRRPPPHPAPPRRPSASRGRVCSVLRPMRKKKQPVMISPLQDPLAKTVRATYRLAIDNRAERRLTLFWLGREVLCCDRCLGRLGRRRDVVGCRRHDWYGLLVVVGHTLRFGGIGYKVVDRE